MFMVTNYVVKCLRLTCMTSANRVEGCSLKLRLIKQCGKGGCGVYENLGDPFLVLVLFCM